MSTKRWCALAVVVAQFAVLAFMAGEREWVMRTGHSVWLRTAPIDPQDPMRGDYVRLDYEIAHVPRGLCRDGVADWFAAPVRGIRDIRDRRVYAELKPDDEGVGELISLSDREPASGLYLRGRADSISNGTIQIRFGVEALFMEQGKARKFVDDQGNRVGVPLDFEVAVGRHGLGVLKSYRWEPLGLTLTLDSPQALPQSQPSASGVRRAGLRGATVELKNHGDRPVAVVIEPRGGSFRLVRRERSFGNARIQQAIALAGNENPYAWVGENRTTTHAPTAEVRVLQPGESYQEHLDFMAPAWFVADTREGLSATPIALGAVANFGNASFRIEYAAPTSAESAGLPHGGLIYHGRLTSRAFSAGARVD
jgi:uncharacterized membrane-anchored protein